MERGVFFSYEYSGILPLLLLEDTLEFKGWSTADAESVDVESLIDSCLIFISDSGELISNKKKKKHSSRSTEVVNVLE